MAIVLFVVLAPIKPGDIAPSIEDSVEIKDYSSIGTEQNTTDVLVIKDSDLIENKPNSDFYFDENGTKHYVIKATDVPILG